MNRFAAIGCLLVTLVCCAGSGVLFFMGARATGAVAAASTACDGIPVPGAAASTTSPSRVLAFSRGASSWVYAGSSLPSSYTDAESPAEASLVFCLEPDEQIELEACSYDGGIVLHRMQASRRVRVVDPSTAAVVREATLVGAPPDACPMSIGTTTAYGVRLGSSDRESVGPAPGHAEVVAAFGDLIR